MKVLAIDPGLTTGVALIEDTTVIATWSFSLQINVLGEVDVHDLEPSEVAGECAFLEERNNPDSIVIEEGPRWGRFHAQALEDLEHELRGAFPDASWVRPSEWKDAPQASVKVDGAKTQHEKDAAHMGLVFAGRSRA